MGILSDVLGGALWLFVPLFLSAAKTSHQDLAALMVIELTSQGFALISLRDTEARIQEPEARIFRAYALSNRLVSSSVCINGWVSP